MSAPKGILVTLILILTLMVSGTYALYAEPTSVDTAVSIIGGSDGPTAVFVTVPAEDAAP